MESSSIFLRAFESDDYVLINKWRNDPEIHKYTGGHILFVSQEREKAWVNEKAMNNRDSIYLAICTNDENKYMIGYISLVDIDHWNRTANVGGILIGDKKHSNSYAAIEASLMLFKYAFEELNINRLYGRAFTDHTNAYYMNKALMYHFEGVLRQSAFKHGTYHDEYIFSILESEYREYVTNGLYDKKVVMRRMLDEMKKDRRN